LLRYQNVSLDKELKNDEAIELAELALIGCVILLTFCIRPQRDEVGLTAALTGSLMDGAAE
jgi:hypothetical protein